MTIRQILLASKLSPPFYVGADAANATTVTLPTHVSGDLILISAIRAGSFPDLPAGYTNLATASVNISYGRTGYKFATSGSETSGTWTGASTVCAAIYRRVVSLGDSGISAGTGSNVNYDGRTISGANSIVLGFVGATGGTVSNAPSGMTNRFSSNLSYDFAIHDTDSVVSSWTTQLASLGSSQDVYFGTIVLRGG